MVKKITYCVYLMSTSFYSMAQFVENPSFENPTGQGKVPDKWTVCETYSTPDTQPGAFGVTQSAAHGNSYASLCGRTNPAPSAGYTEDFETRLLKPLKKDRCYSLSMDLAKSNTFFVEDFGTIYMFNNPMKLAVYGSAGICSMDQTLTITQVINHENWQTYEFTLTPVADVIYLRLYSLYADSIRFCNILIDNLKLTELTAENSLATDTLVPKNTFLKLDAGDATSYEWNPPVGLSCINCREPELISSSNITYTVSMQKGTDCEFYLKTFNIRIIKKEDLFIPNVITPNNDGYNDTFKIRNLPPNSVLTIMNRVGEIVFESDNYDNSWGGIYKGKLLSPDTYWYVLKFDPSQDPATGYIYLKQSE